MTEYDYIRDHLGYRFEVLAAAFPRSHPRVQSFPLSVRLVNRGFSALHNPRPVYFVFVNSAGAVALRSRIDAAPSEWHPFDIGDPMYTPMVHTIDHTAAVNMLAAGLYSVGLSLPDAGWNGTQKSVASLMPPSRSRTASSPPT